MQNELSQIMEQSQPKSFKFGQLSYKAMTPQEIYETVQHMYKQRLFVVGQTGSGKTWAIKKLWEHGPRENVVRVIFDSKGLLDVDGNGNPDPLSDQRKIGNLKTLEHALFKEHDTKHTLIFQPPRRLIEGKIARSYADAALDIVYRYCMQRFKARRSMPYNGARVYVDELGAISTATDIPANWTAFATRGRAIGAAVWGGSQRPCFIPGTAMSESEIKLVGHLDTAKDLEKVAHEMGCHLFRASPQVWAEERGAKEGSPEWFAFWLRRGRKIALINV